MGWDIDKFCLRSSPFAFLARAEFRLSDQQVLCNMTWSLTRYEKSRTTISISQILDWRSWKCKCFTSCSKCLPHFGIESCYFLLSMLLPYRTSTDILCICTIRLFIFQSLCQTSHNCQSTISALQKCIVPWFYALLQQPDGAPVWLLAPTDLIIAFNLT
jgi:hypothetical protein